MVDNISKLKKANESYMLKNDWSLTERILDYIESRIIANEKEIRELINLKETNISFEEILNILKEEKEAENNYKGYSKLRINNQKFLATDIKMPIGTIAIEAFETRSVIKYYIKAITTRNAIAISDVEYDEDNVKNLILIIIKEALKKFEIDDNLIMLLPYDECFYEYFDQVISTYDKNGNTLENPKTDRKEYMNNLYVYLEDETLRDEAEKNENVEIITGNFEDVIKKIDRAQGAAIYTKNSEIAYKFVNFAHCKNVFVNASLDNIQEPKKDNDMFCEYRSIIIPIPQEEIQNIKKENVIEEKINENADMILKKENIFEKIKDFLKKLFL